MDPSRDDALEAISTPLSEVTSLLAEVAAELADNAISVGLEAVDDPDLDVPIAIEKGAPLRLPLNGAPAAVDLIDGAAPVARSAPVVSSAFGQFAPATVA